MFQKFEVHCGVNEVEFSQVIYLNSELLNNITAFF